jgi:hypothetical protein
MTTIPTRTPHNEELDVHLHSNKVTVDALKLAMRVNGAKMSTGSMMLFDKSRGVIIDDRDDHKKRSLASMGVMDGDPVDIIHKMGTLNMADLVFKQFFVKSEPGAMARDIPLDVSISLQFVENAVNNCIYLPSFTLPHEPHSIDQMQNELGDDRAAELGFKKWTDDVYPCKVFLLVLDMDLPGATIHNKLEAVQFSYPGLNREEYLGVDVHSWQRYTNKAPVECDVRFDAGASIPLEMTVVPTARLLPDTWYVLVLQNGVQLTPQEFINGGLCTYCHDSVCEDLLIPFWTADVRVEDMLVDPDPQTTEPKGTADCAGVGGSESGEEQGTHERRDEKRGGAGEE